MRRFSALRQPAAGAETAVIRAITMIWGAATLAFLGISITPIIAAGPYLNLVFETIAVVVIFGTPIFGGIAAPALSRRSLRRLHGAYAVAYLLLVLGWVVALGGRELPSTIAPWIVEITALATVPAALAWRPALAWSYLVVNAVLIFPVRFYSSEMTDVITPLQFAFFTLTYTAIFSVVADAAVRNARALDSVTRQTHDAAARAAAATAVRQEQARLDALIHDAVMGTLYYASRGDEALDPAVRRQAVAALATLEDLRARSDDDGEDVTSAAFGSRIRSVALDAGPGLRVEVSDRRTDHVPGAVAAAFAEATAEAVRNSIQHSRASTAGRVLVELTNRRILVSIEDDGVGFDPRSVAPDRLGITVSMRGRLEAIPGGGVRVESQPGRGTRVLLEWVAR